MRGWVYEQILWFDIPVTNTHLVDVSQRSEGLICIKFDEQVRHRLLHLVIVLQNPVYCLWHVVHYHIQIDLLGLVSICVERLPHFDAVRVVKHFQNLQFSVLVSLVLEHLLDGHGLTSLCDCRLEYYTEGPIPDNFLSVVGETLL